MADSFLDPQVNRVSEIHRLIYEVFGYTLLLVSLPDFTYNISKLLTLSFSSVYGYIVILVNISIPVHPLLVLSPVVSLGSFTQSCFLLFPLSDI